LRLLGIRAEEIEKYIEKDAGHILYRIDTRGVHERRAEGGLLESMYRSLNMELTLPR
jgi:hypothetical protein